MSNFSILIDVLPLMIAKVFLFLLLYRFVFFIISIKNGEPTSFKIFKTYVLVFVLCYLFYIANFVFRYGNTDISAIWDQSGYFLSYIFSFRLF